MNASALREQWAPRLLSLLRIMTALLFMEHGTQKLLGFPPPTNPQPALFSLLGVQGVLELFGGLLLVLGLLTRPVAFLLSGNMAVAYFMAHAPRSFFPVLNGGDAAILYCFVFFFLFAAGPGPWSVDALFRRTGSGLSGAGAAAP
jgi:putative oxidoreductase